MTVPERPDPDLTEERVESRSELLPEEDSVGSDDPKTQAAIILEDSDRRTRDPETTGVESSQTPTSE